jgi:hypothetical protein
MVLPNFWNPLLSLIPFWRAALALVLECYACSAWNGIMGSMEIGPYELPHCLQNHV